jgi:hypothetical protein
LDLDPLREKLIDAMYSDVEAQHFFMNNINNPEILLKLCVICAPYDKYSNDPRMKAAYYISQYSSDMLAGVLPLLMVLLTIPSCDGTDMNGNIACHLINAINKVEKTSVLNLDLVKIANEYDC